MLCLLICCYFKSKVEIQVLGNFILFWYAHFNIRTYSCDGMKENGPKRHIGSITIGAMPLLK